LRLQTAVKTINQMPDCQSAKAFVLDDSIKIRHGKKMHGVSSHFDHTLGRSVILPLAWAGMPKTSFRKNSDSPLFIRTMAVRESSSVLRRKQTEIPIDHLQK
jgi:hypothetical protein